MLKALKKKKKVKIAIPESAAEQIVCGACGHVRKETVKAPDWQCPGCGKAYNKVNHKPDEKRYTRKELQDKNLDYLRGKQKEYEQEQQSIEGSKVMTSLGVGAVVAASGLAKTVSLTCGAAKTFVPENPMLQAVGAIIIAGTLIYAAFRYFS